MRARRTSGYFAAISAILSATAVGDDGVARALRARDGEGDDGLSVELGEERGSSIPSRHLARAGRAAPCARREGRSSSRRAPRPNACRQACGSPARGPPISPRPPARSTFVARTWRLTSPAVTPKASRRSGSSAMRISRVTPPMRLTSETPFTPWSTRTTVSSTNHDSSSGVIAGRARRVGDDRQALDLERVVTGSSIVRGRSVRMREIASLTSFSARSTLVSRRNSMRRHRRAFGHDGRWMCFTPLTPAIGVLDLLRHLRLELGRRGAGLVDAHLDDRHVDVGEARDGQRLEAQHAEHDQHQEQRQRRHRVADRPGRDVPVHRLASLTFASGRDWPHGVAVTQERAGLGDDDVAVGEARAHHYQASVR